jgi:hypothetical protein
MTEKDIRTEAELTNFLKESKGVLIIDFHATYSSPHSQMVWTL